MLFLVKLKLSRMHMEAASNHPITIRERHEIIVLFSANPNPLERLIILLLEKQSVNIAIFPTVFADLQYCELWNN